MSNDSSTGGPLLPNLDPSPTPLEGQGLLRFIQQFVVGITGLDGQFVRPYWQSFPPLIPDAGTAWIAVGVRTRKSETFPTIIHIGSAAGGLGEDELNRYEYLDVLCSCYDLGATAPPGQGGEADFYASLMRDGLAITQNLEVLQLNNMGFVEVGALTGVPTLVKERWVYRIDLSIVLVRHITRRYPVRNIAEGIVDIRAPVGNISGIPETATDVADTGVVPGTG